MADDNTVDINARVNPDGVDSGLDEVTKKLEDWARNTEQMSSAAAGSDMGMIGELLMGAGGAAVIVAGISQVASEVSDAVEAYEKLQDKIHHMNSDTMTWHEQHQKVAATWDTLRSTAGKTIVEMEESTGLRNRGGEGVGQFFMNQFEQFAETGAFHAGPSHAREEREKLLLDQMRKPFDEEQRRSQHELNVKEEHERQKQIHETEREEQRQSREEEELAKRNAAEITARQREEQRHKDEVNQRLSGALDRRDRTVEAEDRRQQMMALRNPEHDPEHGGHIESFDAVFRRISEAAGSTGKRDAEKDREERKEMERKREELRQKFHKEDMDKQDDVIKELRKVKGGLL